MNKEIAELFKNALPLVDTEILQRKICSLFDAKILKLVEEACEEKNLCNYCGKRAKRDVFCSDECAKNAARNCAEAEYDKLLHG